MKKFLFVFFFITVAYGSNLEWDANTEENLAGYNMYRSTTQGTGYVKLNSSLILCGSNDTSCTKYTDDTIVANERYYYVCTAVNTEDTPLESTYSNEVTYSICSGDVNGDFSRDIMDVVAIANHITENILITGDYLLAADVNQDGNVNIIDVVFLLNYIVGNTPMDDCP
jgi:hypothetical protein